MRHIPPSKHRLRYDMPKISLIAAMGHNRVIGVKNKLAWHLAPDLKRFKQLTLGKPMIMGRKTFESLPGLLPDRLHIVVTRTPQPHQEGVIFVSSFEAAVQKAMSQATDEIMVIGGAQIYALSLSQAVCVYLTEVDINVNHGDAFFPVLGQEWKTVHSEGPFHDEKSGLTYTYRTFNRA